ncbi:LuxR C-terminal-related transcriptional regulator [Kitasatospora kifunensis]|uniref:DNA-binding CsgD family transcriptional regulator/sugar-specific transcriptional regulator TrmB n=1 Tax=Kitasatospora kifunensis TaxID=58351 RepID=A0A7W7R5G8_KITKI|nr:LuxR C-terminal-related transcriptional regulator [Kitasatospora kifunensis]MBB4925719.1 DNA-binding CsgD family transcriptional regulator/sugar-specific transcriptional regulator TrmB [Kitasatospora kifunensis]
MAEQWTGRFGGLGLAADQELLYLHLLTTTGLSAGQLGAALGMAAERALAALGALADLGLVERPVADGAVWSAAAPDVALEELLLRRELELRRTRGRITELLRTYRRTSTGPEGELVEVITGRDSIAELWRSLQLGVRHQLRVLDKPPYIRRSDPELELAALGRGVRMRVVYESQVLRDPERVAEIQLYAGAGEQARVLPELPLKLALVDDRWALLPVSSGTELQSVLLVRPSSLLDALAGLFELYWSRAMRVPAADSTDLPRDRHRQLLTLLAAGLTDESIARQMGVSTRTVQRWVRELMDRFGARTRFQAGIQAARADLL